MLKVTLICGGPSAERGISLNSARSVLDHIGNDVEIIPIYFDHKKRAYEISRSQLYSNTPSDFDFKLAETAKPLNQRTLVKRLKEADICFPAIHGPFGEDGELQAWLEKHKIPFVGSGSSACKLAFDKYTSNEYIRTQDFFALPSALLKIYHHDHKKIITDFFKKHKLKRAIVKPATGGSSIGVFSVATPTETLAKATLIFSKRMDTRVIVEPFATGIEFTVIILQNRYGQPTAILPTEIETDYSNHQILDYRKKYLPTRHVTYHCPPRFSNEMIERIQIQAEQLFSLFGMRDFGRFDGWVLPDGKIWFCDFNPISGMEQNSFLFQQATRIGLSHREVLLNILQHALSRYGKSFMVKELTQHKRKPVKVLFGGNTSERQVSLMSGTNVWLKLRGSQTYQPRPFLLDMDGKHVWRLPYQLALNHTVEEIIYNCEHYAENAKRLEMLETKARLRLGLTDTKDTEEFFAPEKMTLNDFVNESENKFVFIGLHGGIGENGTLQHQFIERGISFNGPPEDACRLCMDKYTTSEFIKERHIPGVLSIPGMSITTSYLLTLSKAKLAAFWQDVCKKFNARSLVIKPRADGCSSGVVHLFGSDDLTKYCEALKTNLPSVPAGTFKYQDAAVEMPLQTPENLLLEKFIHTDKLRVKGNQLKYTKVSGWVEMTIGVVEINKKLHALNPSITVAEGEVLSLEEKFQGGTGINITPPPETLLSAKLRARVKNLITEVAKAIGIQGYCRIDIFVELATGNIMVIEINSLPGLTPSTVLYHQALAEQPPIYPREFLELLIKNKGY
jgi:D-alanine--D-alanine ligase